MGSKTGKPGKLHRNGSALVRTVPRKEATFVVRKRQDLDSYIFTARRLKKPARAIKSDPPATQPEIQTRIQGTDMVYYWAYGSNLWKQQMRRRCPRSQEAGPFNVNGVRLVFRGVADVVTDPDGYTPGALYKVSRSCVESLDTFEGVRSGLYLKRYFKITRDGQDYKCLFYQMAIDRGIQPPSQEYLTRIADGYVDFNLNLDYLDIAVQESWDNKHVTPFLRERHRNRGNPRLARSIFDLQEDVK